MALLDSAPLGLLGTGTVVLVLGLGLAGVMDRQVASELTDVTAHGVGVTQDGVRLQELAGGYEVWEVAPAGDDLAEQRPLCSLTSEDGEVAALEPEHDDTVDRRGVTYLPRYSTVGTTGDEVLTCTGGPGSLWVVPAEQVAPGTPRALREIGLVAGVIGGAATATGAAGALRRRRQDAGRGFAPTVSEVVGIDRLHPGRTPQDSPPPRAPRGADQRASPLPPAPPPGPEQGRPPATVDPDRWPAPPSPGAGYVFPAPDRAREQRTTGEGPARRATGEGDHAPPS